MRSGFYSVRRVEQDEDDDSAGVVILAHAKDGRFVGVDQGGCKLSGTYETRADGTTTVSLVYSLRAGTELPNGAVLHTDTTIPSQFVLNAMSTEGAVQSVDFGVGPVLIRFAWLSEPV